MQANIDDTIKMYLPERNKEKLCELDSSGSEQGCGAVVNKVMDLPVP
jgi:hypothetical protein